MSDIHIPKNKLRASEVYTDYAHSPMNKERCRIGDDSFSGDHH